eukprot:4983934-Prymnesium_polylepis.2
MIPVNCSSIASRAACSACKLEVRSATLSLSVCTVSASSVWSTAAARSDACSRSISWSRSCTSAFSAATVLAPISLVALNRNCVLSCVTSGLLSSGGPELQPAFVRFNNARTRADLSAAPTESMIVPKFAKATWLHQSGGFNPREERLPEPRL